MTKVRLVIGSRRTTNSSSARGVWRWWRTVWAAMKAVRKRAVWRWKRWWRSIETSAETTRRRRWSRLCRRPTSRSANTALRIRNCAAAAIVRGALGGADGGENAGEIRSKDGSENYDALYYVHVGDTRLYLIRDGQITRVTRDHSYVGRLVESGVISAEEAETHPQRNILTAALGTNPDLIMDSPARPEPLRPDDVLLICSDGLWGQVHDSEILDAVENKSAEQAGRELIELARERGGPDNITVEILRLR